MKHLALEVSKLLDYQTLLYFPEVCNRAIIKQHTTLHEFLFKLLQLLHTATVSMDSVNERRDVKD